MNETAGEILKKKTGITGVKKLTRITKVINKSNYLAGFYKMLSLQL